MRQWTTQDNVELEEEIYNESEESEDSEDENPLQHETDDVLYLEADLDENDLEDSGEVIYTESEESQDSEDEKSLQPNTVYLSKNENESETEIRNIS